MAIRTPWGCWLMKSALVRTVCGCRIWSGRGHPVGDPQGAPALRPGSEKGHVGHRRFQRALTGCLMPKMDAGRVLDAPDYVPWTCQRTTVRVPALPQGMMQPVRLSTAGRRRGSSAAPPAAVRPLYRPSPRRRKGPVSGKGEPLTTDQPGNRGREVQLPPPFPPQEFATPRRSRI